ncbi:hypothetical protein D3C80_1592980 [compost metagenome]
MSLIRGPATNSTIADRAEPLWPPKVSIAPLRAASASVVGLPAASIAQPSGMALPALRYSSISPRAEALVAKSKMKGFLPSRGQPKANGLVPKEGFVPPAGATQQWLGVTAKETSPASAKASTSGQRAEKWKQLLMAIAATPCFFVFSMKCGRPA